MQNAMKDNDNQQWAAIDHTLTDQAPAAILATPRHIDLISSRVQNYVYSDQFRWVLSQAQVK
jgi:peptide/nickel transport system substrate-binding protein